MSSTRGRVHPRRAHLQRAASVRKIGRTISSSSFLQHKRVKSQRRIHRSICGSSSRSLRGHETPVDVPRRGVGRSLSSDDVLSSEVDDAEYPISKTEQKRAYLGRSLSSDDILNRKDSERNVFDFEDEIATGEEEEEGYSPKKDSSGGLMGAVACNYEKGK